MPRDEGYDYCPQGALMLERVVCFLKEEDHSQ